MQDHFYRLIAALAAELPETIGLHGSLNGEASDFIRFNHNRVRQAGHVEQYCMQLALVSGQKHCIGDCELSGDWQADITISRSLMNDLQALLVNCPDDPYLHYNDQPASSDDQLNSTLPAVSSIAATITEAAAGLDLVGIYAGGDILRGYANSYGQKNWHSRTIFNFDWSCHSVDNQAVKSSYTGSDWVDNVLAEHINEQRQALALLQRPAKKLQPARYRAYLAPTALAELLQLLACGGFSLRELRTCQSPLLKLAQNTRTFSPLVSMHDNRGTGLEPLFTDEGFILPATVNLIADGRMTEPLVDARAAREYDVQLNAAADVPESLQMSAGDLATDDILPALDCGLYINHLWYANFSDTNNCRMTGITRYACFWVEQGKISAPLEVMRFDDSLYRLLGDQLEAVTAERRFMHSADTYEQRSLASMHLPGILCKELTLTL